MKNQTSANAKPIAPAAAPSKIYNSPSVKTHSADRLREALSSVNAATNLNPNP